VSSDASPAGYRWHELHITRGHLDRESSIVSSTLQSLMQAHADGRLSDFRIVEGASYLDMRLPPPIADLPDAAPSPHAPFVAEPNAAY
jgi:hypothetical protein